MDYTNLQVTQTNAACLCNITDNAASAEIKGVEAEFSLPADRQPAARRCPVRTSMRSTRTSSSRRSIRARASGWTARTIACSARPRRRSAAASTTRWASAAGARRSTSALNYTWQSDMYWATDNIASEDFVRPARRPHRRSRRKAHPGRWRSGASNVTDELYRTNIISFFGEEVSQFGAAAHLRRRLHLQVLIGPDGDGRCASRRTAPTALHRAEHPVVETTAICRFCHATCGLKVTIEQGRVVDIIGDIDNPVYHGYSCVKGRNYHEFHYDPQRVLHPLRRDATGCVAAGRPRCRAERHRRRPAAHPVRSTVRARSRCTAAPSVTSARRA